MDATRIRKQETVRLALGFTAATLIAQGAGVAGQLTLMQLLLANPPELIPAAQFLPFALVSAIVAAYIRPVIRDNLLPGPDHVISEQARRRLLNAPIMLSAAGMLGWVCAFVVVWLGLPEAELRHLGMIGMTFLTAAAVTFLAGYYLLETLTQKFSIPRFFKDNRLSTVKGVIKISLTARLLLLGTATAGFPLATLLLFGYRLSDVSGPEQDRVFVAMSVSAALLAAAGTGLTLLVANAYSTALRAALVSTKRILAGKFDVALAVRTTDEVGRLTEAVNDMAAGLEERERIRDAFGKMVDPAVRDLAIAGRLELGGVLSEVTVLFCDLRNFTSIAEQMTPPALVELLNRYFQVMARCITLHEGHINKFIGDAILGVFGAPLAIKNHALAASRAALAMRDALRYLNTELQAEGTLELGAGIGLHSGTVVAGTIGSRERMEYTVIGDAVNVASRIEHMCKEVGHDILISETVAASIAPTFKPTYETTAELRGRTSEIKLYRI